MKVLSRVLNFYLDECYNLGNGITIPFINMINEKYKDYNMFVSGLLGTKI